MDFKHRKLMSDSINETSKYDCNICDQFCLPSCADFCPGSCIPNSAPYIDQYPPPSPISDSTPHTNSTNKFLIVTSTIIAAAFLVLCCLVYYIKCFRQRSNRRRRSSPRAETRDEFFDEDHGPIVDHPIWYINTVGLQPSIIHSISVCKYKKGEGLVEGTDCSVCLNEFQEDETLRLLPKCNHAFHIPCIDTWLRSHTSCPMCRAPIVFNAGGRGQRPLLSSSSSSDVNNEDSGGTEEQTQVVIMEDGHNGEAEGGTNGGISEINDEDDELGVENLGTKDETQPVRRSVSLDSMAVCQINKDLFNGGLEGSNSNSDKGREQSLRIVSRRGSGNQSLLRFMCQSSNGRSLQSNQNFMRRSVSFSGIFSLPMSNNKSHNTNPPSRSF